MSFAEIAALTLHDVKNRLAQLAGRAEARGDRETLREALEAADTLTRLLAYYRSDVGSLAVDIDAHAPADLVAEFAGGEAGCRVVVDAAAAPTLGFYDENLVRMVLANAVQNACRYARAQVTVNAAEHDGYLEFSVRDDGEGYPSAVLADATGEAAPVTREGTGLGLRLARRIAALHENAEMRGRVELANDGGAVFRLLLPK